MLRRSLALATLALVLPTQVLARPITTPSRENSAAMTWFSEAAATKHVDATRLGTDVDLRDPAYGAVALLQKKGFLKGFADGSIKTWAAVSRAEALQLVTRALDGGSPTSVDAGAQLPSDVDAADPLAPLVQALVASDRLRLDGAGRARLGAPATVNELRLLLQLPAAKGGDHPATRGEAFRLIVDRLPMELGSAYTPGVPAQIAIQDRDIVVAGQPIRGLMANWQVRDSFSDTPDREAIGRELDRMKAMGFIGVSTEVGWEDMMPDEASFTPPPSMDALFDEAASRGMWVTLLLAPHYTPRWVFQKYGDIALRDVRDQKVAMGEYMTFSPSSPATEDQIAWQKRAAAHYAQHGNLLALFLSNEQSYGNKQDLDYSHWAETRWQQWRSLHGLADAPMPRSATSPERLSWQRFRQDNLLEFLNRSAETVAAALPRFIPVSHKVIFYEATSAYAPNYGLHPTPGRLRWDIVGADIYGVTANVYPAQLAHEKPIVVVETNLPGDWDAEAMRQYLVYQATQGIAIQTIYRWNPCEDENCLFHRDGRRWRKAELIPDAARTIAALPRQLPIEQPSVAILVPTNAVAVTGDLYRSFQYRFDDIATRYESTPGVVLSLLWSDDLLPDPGAQSNLAPQDLLRGIQTIYAILPATDRDRSDGRLLLDWVSNGGTIYVDQDQAGNLPWIGRTAPGTTARGAGSIVVCSGHC